MNTGTDNVVRSIAVALVANGKSHGVEWANELAFSELFLLFC